MAGNTNQGEGDANEYIRTHGAPVRPEYFPPQADYYRFFSPTTGRACYVLRGDQAPTVTGGYGKWNVIERPRRTGLTTFAGYDPITMDVPVRFEAYLPAAEKEGVDIENDIQTLEFLAGRGVGSANIQKNKTPPYISIATFDSSGHTVYVLGDNYTFDEHDQETPPHWVITNIRWDADALFNKRGRRIRQTAVIELTQQVLTPGGKLGTKHHSGPKVVTRHSTSKMNTMSKLSKGWHNTRADVRKLNANKKSLKPYLRDFSKKLPHGTAVRMYVR